MGLPIRHIRWLANQADNVVPSADDLKRFGPQAARVRALLDFIPKLSTDAATVSGYTLDDGFDASYAAALAAADDAAKAAGRTKQSTEAARAAYRLLAGTPRYNASETAAYAANTESIGDRITPKIYRTITNPLATGREADRVNMNAPENVMGIIRDLSERNLIRNPQDVRSARKLADLSDYERNPVMEYINTILGNDYTGYRYPGSAYKSLEEIIKAAKII